MLHHIPLHAACAALLLVLSPNSIAGPESDHPDQLWVAQPSQLTAYSLADGGIRHQRAMSDVKWLASDPATGRIWIGVGIGMRVLGPDAEMLDDVPLPHPQAGDTGVAIDGLRRTAWIAAGDNLLRYSADDYRSIDTVALGDAVRSLALDEVSGNVFVLVGNTVLRVDVAGNVATLPLPALGALALLSFDLQAHRLWAAGRNAVVAVDAAGNGVVGPLPHG